jgi:hypothetical protein
MLKYGLCGQTGGDCSYWNTSTYPAALASTPDIVTVMLGEQYNFTCIHYVQYSVL